MTAGFTKRALAETVGLSPTPCWTRLARLEKAGLITGYHARIAPEILGPVTTVMLEVSLKSHTRADFETVRGGDARSSSGGGLLGASEAGWIISCVSWRLTSARYQDLIDFWLCRRDRNRPLLHLHRYEGGQGQGGSGLSPPRLQASKPVGHDLCAMRSSHSFRAVYHKPR